jgi:hypothetical protein
LCGCPVVRAATPESPAPAATHQSVTLARAARDGTRAY